MESFWGNNFQLFDMFNLTFFAINYFIKNIFYRIWLNEVHLYWKINFFNLNSLNVDVIDLFFTSFCCFIFLFFNSLSWLTDCLDTICLNWKILNKYRWSLNFIFSKISWFCLNCFILIRIFLPRFWLICLALTVFYLKSIHLNWTILFIFSFNCKNIKWLL